MSYFTLWRSSKCRFTRISWPRLPFMIVPITYLGSHIAIALTPQVNQTWSNHTIIIYSTHPEVPSPDMTWGRNGGQTQWRGRVCGPDRAQSTLELSKNNTAWQWKYNGRKITSRPFDLYSGVNLYYQVRIMKMRPEDTLHIEQIKNLGHNIKKRVGINKTKVQK